jgi:hypothetical protein
MKLIDVRDKATTYVDRDGRKCHESLYARREHFRK